MSQASDPPQQAGGLHPELPNAVALHQAGRLDEASKIYRAILADDPSQFDATHLLGVIALQQERFKEAQERILAALQIEPTNAGARANLSAAYLRDHQFEQALIAADEALRSDPDSVDARINLGTALFELGRFGEAIGPLQVARGLAPRSAHILNLLGASHLKTGDTPRAAEAFQEATSVAPSDADSWANLSTALNAIGEHKEALDCAERAVALRQDSASGLGSQAAALFELGKIDEAIAIYRKAVEHSPSVEVYCAFANALLTTGLNEEACDYLRRAIDINGNNAYARWILAISTLKAVYDTTEEIIESRASFARAVHDLKTWYLSTSSPYAFAAVGACQPFYIAYQEFNNRSLLAQFGDLCVTWMDSFHLAPAPSRSAVPRTHKMRIGIASAHLHEHSVWNAITKGWVYGLDQKNFEIFLFHLTPTRDKETAQASAHFDFFEDDERTLSGWINSIQGAQLDALIYPEIGMQALTYQLASRRLAPIQAVSWGHPETSGMPHIDFYLSGDALEPAEAQEYYSETLVRLPNLGIYIDELRPKIQDANLKQLGLPTNEPLLLCPGTPFKYLPAHDEIWIRIARGLRANGGGRLVFFSGTNAMYRKLFARLRQSFDSAGVDFNASVCLAPLLNRGRYFGLMQKSTLLLDTVGFSGVNTALQAVECGLPVLAYDGQFMRGRLASGVMRLAGLPELIACNQDEFVQRAVELAADKRALKRIRASLAERKHTLFRDTAPVQALNRFLESEIKARRR